MTEIGKPRNPAWHQSGLRCYLHKLRKEWGMTQADLAKELGYAMSQINAWERGYSAPNFIQLQEWASVFAMRIFIAPITANENINANQGERQERQQSFQQQRDMTWLT